MLECIKFILTQCANFCKMLFTIDIGNSMSLGSILCIIFIFLPVCYRVVTFIKHDVIGELDEIYDESKPRESWTSTEHQRLKTGNGQWFSTNHTRSRSRRYKL